MVCPDHLTIGRLFPNQDRRPGENRALALQFVLKGGMGSTVRFTVTAAALPCRQQGQPRQTAGMFAPHHQRRLHIRCRCQQHPAKARQPFEVACKAGKHRTQPHQKPGPGAGILTRREQGSCGGSGVDQPVTVKEVSGHCRVGSEDAWPRPRRLAQPRPHPGTAHLPGRKQGKAGHGNQRCRQNHDQGRQPV